MHSLGPPRRALAQADHREDAEARRGDGEELDVATAHVFLRGWRGDGAAAFDTVFESGAAARLRREGDFCPLNSSLGN